MRGAMKIASRFWMPKKTHGDDKRMRPIAPLRGGDQDRRDPAEHDADVRNHGQNDDEQADERREV